MESEKPSKKPTDGTLTSSLAPSDPSAYSCLDLETLVDVFEGRGFGDVRRLIVNALVEQDKQHAKHPFPFMSLPAEIRNWIYGYVIPQDNHLFLPRGYGEDCSELWQPNLTRVDSLIRRESLSIFYGSNTFRLYITSDCRIHGATGVPEHEYWLADPSHDFLERLVPHIDLLRNIKTNLVPIYVKGARFLSRLEFDRDTHRNPQYRVRSTLPLGHQPSGKDIKAANEFAQACLQSLINERKKTFDFSATSLDELLEAFAVKIDHDNRVASEEL